MVRLKARGRMLVTFRSRVFQFHYGTIKRVAKAYKSDAYEANFNSIMVRLKGAKNNINIKTYKISIPLWYD